MRAWTDAAGISRWLAAVILTEEGFLWTRAKIPPVVWRQLLARSDEQIGGQELMAVPLLTATFKEHLQGALVILAIDNQGVVGSLVRGAGSACDHNAAIARVWLDFAADAISPWIVRVETKCNVADGPTRQAIWTEPRWLPWVQDFGSMEDEV